MAELAIPVLALAGMYVISNQNKKTKKENFSNMNLSENLTKEHLQDTSKIVNSNIVNNNNNLNLQLKTNQNPDLNLNPNINMSNIKSTDKSNLQQQINYNNNEQYTDKYFNNNTYNIIDDTQDNDFLSLTGNIMKRDDFKHNNMKPFFGARIRGPSSSNDGLVDSKLDNMQGSGSLLKNKCEQAPLFQPHNNMNHTNGAPNMSDFFQSRVNSSLKNSNVVPWKQEQVGPGLNQSFNNNQSYGFNSALEGRDLWQPKTVDDLRVLTNPKQTFNLDGHQGPLNSYVKENSTMKHQGKVEKYGPDTHYTVGPRRWFTTTGIEKAPTVHSQELLQEQNRIDTTREYYGVGDHDKATYVKGNYEKSRRTVLAPTDVPSGYAPGTNEAREGDYGINSFKVLPNSRTTTNQPDNIGGIYGMAKAVVAPLMDILRPSKKENVVGNIRLSGNVQTEVESLPIYNPADRTKTTIRETTKDKHHKFIGNQDSNAYLVNKQQAVDNNRMNTSIDYTGNACHNNAPTTYDAAYRQRNNVNKNSIERINTGCNQIFSQTDNISIAKKDSDRNNNRMWVSNQPFSSNIPSAETHGKINAPQYYDNSINNDRINPDILTAFKNNPYTQSLSSY